MSAGELGALLLEARLIKERQPVHKRQLRVAHKLFSLSLAAGLNQIPLPWKLHLRWK
jgi:DNA polymerase-3 subunit epsilon